jgi:hypothetical protein
MAMINHGLWAVLLWTVPGAPGGDTCPPTRSRTLPLRKPAVRSSLPRRRPPA